MFPVIKIDKIFYRCFIMDEDNHAHLHTNIKIIFLSSVLLLCRSYLVEQDWTQSGKKEGTFVLETSMEGSGLGSTPASIRTSSCSRPSSTRLPG